MGVVSNTTTVTIAANSTPSWWSDNTFHPVGEWKAYAGGTWNSLTDSRQQGSTMFDVSPTTTTGIYAYSGAAIDQSGKRLLILGGGHSDYNGNEVIAVNLNTNTPAYSVLSARSAGYASDYPEGNNGSGQSQADVGVVGNPRSSHTSCIPQYHNGKLFMGQLWGLATGSGGTPSTSARFSMDGTTGVWTTLGKTVATAGFNANEGPSICLVESRNEYWGGYDGITTQTDPFTYCMDTTTGALKPSAHSATGVYVRGGAVPLSSGQARFGSWGIACEIYPSGSRPSFILNYQRGNGQVGAGFWLIDPTAPHLMYGPLTINNTSGVAISAGGASVTRSSLFHLWGTSTIYMCAAPWKAVTGGYDVTNFLKITIPAGDTGAALAAATWNIELISPSGAVPPNTDDKVYGRFSLLRDMGDGRPAMVAVPKRTDTKTPVYVLKMPAGGL